jgi:hypothetical protein
MALVYDYRPGVNLNFQLLDGCAVYASGYGVSGAVNTGELGGWTTPTGQSYLSIGTFNSTSYVQDREATFLLNLTSMDTITFTLIAGNDSNGGERPNNAGESLYVRGPNGATRLLAYSGQDGGYTFPDIGGQEVWFDRSITLNEDEKVVGLWRIYAFSIQQPEFAGTGGIYDSNVNAGDRYGVCRLQIYGTPPTTITNFSANGGQVSTEINPGDPVVFAWNTKIGTLSTATSTSINNGIGNVTPVDSGTYNLVVGPTQTTVYTLTAVGATGTATETVTVTVIAPDTEPDLFTFPSVQGADLSTLYTSDTVTIGGIGPGISLNVSATNNAETSVAGGAFSTATKTITNGQTLRVRMTSSASYDTTKTTTVSVGTVSGTWSISTKSPPAQIPNVFTFNNVIDAPLSAYTTSNIVTITGITTSVTVTAPTNGTYTQSSVNGGAFSNTAKTISNGQTLQLRILTSNVLGDTRTTQIQVGDGAPVNWQVTNVSVADGSPDYFSIAPYNNAPANTEVNSAIFTVTGINVPSSITTTNGALISINGGTYGTSPQTVNNNDNISIRITSSSIPGGEVSTIVTIGNGSTTLSNTWVVTTTTAGDTLPDDFFFFNVNNQPPGIYVYSNTVILSGITSPSTITVSGGAQASVNGGAWATTVSASEGDTLQLRILSSATLGATLTSTITAG